MKNSIVNYVTIVVNFFNFKVCEEINHNSRFKLLIHN
jgi:hypothetical protein